jgi:hypothetical protein
MKRAIPGYNRAVGESRRQSNSNPDGGSGLGSRLASPSFAYSNVGPTLGRPSGPNSGRCLLAASQRGVATRVMTVRTAYPLVLFSNQETSLSLPPLDRKTLEQARHLAAKPEAMSKAEAKRQRKQQLNLRRRTEMEAYLAMRRMQGD